VAPVRFRYACSNTGVQPLQALELTLQSSFKAGTGVAILPVLRAPGACSAYTECGLIATKSTWDYNERGVSLYPGYTGGLAFFNPTDGTPAPAWQQGVGVFGNQGYPIGYAAERPCVQGQSVLLQNKVPSYQQ